MRVRQDSLKDGQERTARGVRMHRFEEPHVALLIDDGFNGLDGPACNVPTERQPTDQRRTLMPSGSSAPADRSRPSDGHPQAFSRV